MANGVARGQGHARLEDDLGRGSRTTSWRRTSRRRRRRVRPEDLARRAASRPTSRSTRRSAAEPVLAKLPDDRPVLRADLRAATRSTRSARSSTTRPTSATRSRRRRSRCSTRRRTRRRSLHELAHMWFGDSVTLRDLAGHLAARGLRDLVGVDLERAAPAVRRPQSVRRAVRDAGDRRRVLEPAARATRAGRRPVRRHGLRPRRA